MNPKPQFVDIEVDSSLKIGKLPPANSKVGSSISESKGVKDLQAFSPNFEDKSLSSGGNSFADAVYLAFKEHIPLELAPQHFWLLILIGFAQHMSLNSEALRDKFVDFKGKKELEVDRPQFVWKSRSNNWPSVFEEFTDQISKNIGAKNFQNISGKFSQTTPTEQAVLNLTIMDSMQEFFSFTVNTLCGISKIRLRGSKDDWVELKNKIQGLEQYDLGWWVPLVTPIVDEIIEGYSGKKNQRFWTSIYKQYSTRGSGAVTRVNGWFQNFFPYVSSEGKFQRNTNLRPLDKILEEFSGELETDLPKSMIPKAIRLVPFVWNYYGQKHQMRFVSGFSGVAVNKDGFIQPIIAWGIGEKKEEAKGPFQIYK